MREIIPLKKDLVFKTLIGKITSIDINHEYKVKNEIVDGNVILSGTYKMTEASVIEEDFYYKIPFGVALSKRINKDTIKIDIDDFTYEYNKDILSVNIDLEFTCDEDKEEEQQVDNYNEEEEIENDIQESTNIDVDQNIMNITNNIVNNDNNYYTYKVYIVRKGDNIETICSKYNITSNDLKEYNNIDDIKEGDKIIIPQIND